MSSATTLNLDWFKILSFGKEFTITRRQDFRLVQIETNCIGHFKVHLKKKKKLSYTCRIENIVREGEIACYKQFLLFSQSFPQLMYIFSASNYGIVW